MPETVYLVLDEVIVIHDDLMQLSGSPPYPLLRRDLLESALARPLNAANYEEADLIRQATLLAVGVSQSQGFGDGNKRTALGAADVFLRLNGLLFHGNPTRFGCYLEFIAQPPEDPDDERVRRACIARVTDQFEHWLRRWVRKKLPEDE